MSMYQHSGNSHDRRKAKRAHLHAAHKQRAKTEAATLAVWTPIGLALCTPEQLAEAQREAKAMREEREALRFGGSGSGSKSDYMPPAISTHEPGFVFIEGGSVRNKRTKSVATMLYECDNGSDIGRCITVKRRDNRTVDWPLDECENWNV